MAGSSTLAPIGGNTNRLSEPAGCKRPAGCKIIVGPWKGVPVRLAVSGPPGGIPRRYAKAKSQGREGESLRKTIPSRLFLPDKTSMVRCLNPVCPRQRKPDMSVNIFRAKTPGGQAILFAAPAAKAVGKANGRATRGPLQQSGRWEAFWGVQLHLFFDTIHSDTF